MEYTKDEDGSIKTTVNSKDGRSKKSLKEFLIEDVDDSLHELIRTNVLTATRNFQHRVNAFRKEVLMGENNSMNIKHISYRVEFQGRGAAHIHGTLWLDMKRIEKILPFTQIDKNTETKHLSEAFRKLRDDLKLNDDEKKPLLY